MQLTSDTNAAIELERGETMGDLNYALIRAHSEDVAGVMQITPEMGPMPPMWNIYFAAADVDESVAKAQSLGGNVMVPAMDIPDISRFAGLTDSQGAFFSIFKGRWPSSHIDLVVLDVMEVL